MLFQIAQVLNRSLQEDPMHAKDALIKKLVPLVPKAPTQVCLSVSLFILVTKFRHVAKRVLSMELIEVLNCAKLRKIAQKSKKVFCFAEAKFIVFCTHCIKSAWRNWQSCSLG